MTRPDQGRADRAAALPRISVITVVRNGLPFVAQTIRSVLSQTYDRVEYIVVDGGSDDGTVDIVKAHASRLSHWLSEPDEGIADAFNKGLSLATGDYILFLNSDDALAGPDVLREAARQIAIHGFPALLYGDCDVLDRNSGKVRYRVSIGFSVAGLKQGQMMPHPSLLTHRAYFEKYGGFDTDYLIAMDYEWLLRGVLKERVVHVPLLMTNVRLGGAGTVYQKRGAKEIVKAQKKNKYIRTLAGEYKLRGYFFIRSFARAVLGRLGLYEIFAALRNSGSRWIPGRCQNRGED